MIQFVNKLLNIHFKWIDSNEKVESKANACETRYVIVHRFTMTTRQQTNIVTLNFNKKLHFLRHKHIYSSFSIRYKSTSNMVLELFRLLCNSGGAVHDVDRIHIGQPNNIDGLSSIHDEMSDNAGALRCVPLIDWWAFLVEQFYTHFGADKFDNE